MKRDSVIDSLRGLLIVYMFAEHLLISPFRALSWVRRFVDFPFGWTPVAAGFIFISGMVIGLGFGNLYERRGADALRRLCRKQAFRIYLTHTGTFALVVLGALAWPQMVSGGGPLAAVAETPGRSFILGGLLLFQPGFFDILPMYCLYLLATSACLTAFKEGKALGCLAVSAGLWLAAQFGLDPWLRYAVSHVRGASLGLFNPLAWQAVYVAGLYFGYRRLDAGGLTTRVPERLRKPLALIAGGTALVFFALRWGLFAPTPQWLESYMWARKGVFPPLMALNFAAFCYVLALVTARRRNAFTWRWLGFVGKHPLICFAFHLVIVSYLTIWWRSIAVLPQPAGFVLLALVVLTVTAPAAVEDWWQRRKTRRPALTASVAS